MKFIHLSDLHLSTPGASLHGLDPLHQLGLCVSSICERHRDAAFCIVSGDITHSGEASGYEAAREILSELPMPVRLMIGNHDDREAFQVAFPDACCDPHGFVQQAFATDIGRFILLDTHEPGSAAGRLCDLRLGWLVHELENSDEPIYLFMHHPPFNVGFHRMDAISLAAPEVLLAALRRHRPRIRHMFLGHLHRSLAGSWHGIPISCVRGTSHQIALDFVTQNTAPVSFETPGYAVVLASDDQTIVHFSDV